MIGKVQVGDRVIVKDADNIEFFYGEVLHAGIGEHLIEWSDGHEATWVVVDKVKPVYRTRGLELRRHNANSTH